MKKFVKIENLKSLLYQQYVWRMKEIGFLKLFLLKT